LFAPYFIGRIKQLEIYLEGCRLTGKGATQKYTYTRLFTRLDARWQYAGFKFTGACYCSFNQHFDRFSANVRVRSGKNPSAPGPLPTQPINFLYGASSRHSSRIKPANQWAQYGFSNARPSDFIFKILCADKAHG
jgi:hypothetical protein